MQGLTGNTRMAGGRNRNERRAKVELLLGFPQERKDERGRKPGVGKCESFRQALCCMGDLESPGGWPCADRRQGEHWLMWEIGGKGW